MYGLRNTRCDPLDCLRVEFTVSCERLCSRRVTQCSRRQLSRHLNTTAASPPPSALCPGVVMLGKPRNFFYTPLLCLPTTHSRNDRNENDNNSNNKS